MLLINFKPGEETLARNILGGLRKFRQRRLGLTEGGRDRPPVRFVKICSLWGLGYVTLTTTNSKDHERCLR